MENCEEIWKVEYPEKYNKFIEWYGHTLISIHMAFLKRMRRHKCYPRNGMLAPVYDLETGKIIMGFNFIVVKSNKIIINKFTEQVANNFTVKSISEAWEKYLYEIDHTFKST